MDGTSKDLAGADDAHGAVAPEDDAHDSVAPENGTAGPVSESGPSVAPPHLRRPMSVSAKVAVGVAAGFVAALLLVAMVAVVPRIVLGALAGARGDRIGMMRGGGFDVQGIEGEQDEGPAGRGGMMGGQGGRFGRGRYGGGRTCPGCGGTGVAPDTTTDGRRGVMPCDPDGDGVPELQGQPPVVPTPRP